jgi:hypothetical protein
MQREELPLIVVMLSQVAQVVEVLQITQLLM